MDDEVTEDMPPVDDDLGAPRPSFVGYRGPHVTRLANRGVCWRFVCSCGLRSTWYPSKRRAEQRSWLHRRVHALEE